MITRPPDPDPDVVPGDATVMQCLFANQSPLMQAVVCGWLNANYFGADAFGWSAEGLIQRFQNAMATGETDELLAMLQIMNSRG